MKPGTLELYQNTLKAAREAAKHQSTVVPIMVTAYVAIVSLSGLKQSIGNNLLFALLFVAPAFLWILALLSSLQVLMPEVLSAASSEEVRLSNFVGRKIRQLRTSQLLLVAGLIFMMVDVLLYFAFVPMPLERPIVVVTPTP